MFRKILLASLIVSISSMLLFAYNISAKPNIKPGLWKFTVKMTMPGMPYNMPEATSEKCITDADLIPKTDSPNQECKIKNQKISGNTISYSIDCKQEGTTTKGNAKLTYSGKKMQGKMNITVKPGNTKMVNNISGSYVGACPK